MILCELWLALAILHDTVFWAVITHPSELALKIKRLFAIIPVSVRPNIGAFINWEWNLILSSPQTWNPEKSWCVNLVAKVEKAWTRKSWIWTSALYSFPPSLPYCLHLWDRDDNNSYPKMSWWSWNHMRSLIGNKTHYVLGSVLRTITCFILFNPYSKVRHKKLFSIWHMKH